jgi:2-hydroxychromene-2-carboxylate isomerase
VAARAGFGKLVQNGRIAFFVHGAYDMTAPIEIWFEFGSNYSYLSVMRIEALVRAAGVELHWKPFLLGPIFREMGWKEPPFVAQKEKGAYAWRDTARRAAKYGLPFARPSEFPRRGLLPMRVAVLAAREPWIAEFCRRIMLRNFARDLEIDSPDAVREALQGLAPDAGRLIEAAGEEAAKTALREQTAQARRLGIFGAPTFIVGDEMYWGDDRLEDALEHAARA